MLELQAPALADGWRSRRYFGRLHLGALGRLRELGGGTDPGFAGSRGALGFVCFLTLCGTGVMRWCFQQHCSQFRSAVPRVVQAFGGGLLFTYTVLLLVHTLAGTPHILLTLAAGVLPNFIFCLIYVSLLIKTSTLHTTSDLPTAPPSTLI